MKSAKSILLILTTTTLSLLFFVLVLAPRGVYAGGSLYLSPGARTVSQGSSFYVSVRANTGGAPVNAVQANLSYDASKLDFLGIGAGGSVFGIQAEGSGGGGSVRIGRGTIGSVSGDVLVATVTFRARVSSGSATVSFAGGSEMDNSGNPIEAGTSGGTYTFSSVAAQSESVQSGGGGSTTSTTPTANNTPVLKISDLKVTDVSRSQATVVWKTKDPADSLVEYGTGGQFFLSASSVDLVKDHKVTIATGLTAAQTYNLRVKSKDSAGNIGTSGAIDFITEGFKVKIKLNDGRGKPIPGAQVTLYSEPQVAKTDTDGVAEFSNVSSGKHAISIEYKGKRDVQQVDVKEADQPQSFDVKVASIVVSPKVNWLYVLVPVVTLIIVAAGFSFYWFRVRKKRSPPPSNPI